MYGNKTERKAVEFLLKEHGFKKLEEIIKQLPGLVSLKYAPRITTPYQLQQRLGDLILFIKQNKK